MDYKKLKLALRAGARGIETNKRVQGSEYCVDPMNLHGQYGEISYYQAQILLSLASECVSDDGIDLERLSDFVDNLDKYEIKRS